MTRALRPAAAISIALACSWVGYASGQSASGVALEFISGSRMSREGAIVAGLVARAGTNEPMPRSITITKQRRSIELPGTVIAPGLARFAPSVRLRTGTYAVTGAGAANTEVVAEGTPRPGVPTTPVIREARRVALATTEHSETHSGEQTSNAAALRVDIRAILEFPVPQGVVAIVVYWGESGTTAATWSRAIQGTTEIALWRDEENRLLPGRLSPPREGGYVRIAFVDTAGQVSQPSRAVRIE